MINLNEYGWEDSYETEHFGNEIPARITEVHRQRFKAVCEYGEVHAGLKGTFYKAAKEREDMPAIGDFVYIQYNQGGDSLITKLCQRKSKFSRVDYSGHVAGYVKTVKEQVVAANFDYVFIVVSLNHDFNLGRIERYLSAAFQSGGRPVVVLTKADLCQDAGLYVERVKKLSAGKEGGEEKGSFEFDVLAVSSVSGYGLDSLKEYMKEGCTVVLLGSSGVGKSSLVNALAGEEIMEVSEIRERDSRGRHTTTHRQLLRMPSKSMIIDTPGMRELGMWDVGEGIQDVFSDVTELKDRCRFHNCTHGTEPGCAVRGALEEGILTKERWERYQRLMKENEWGKSKMTYSRKKNYMGK